MTTVTVSASGAYHERDEAGVHTLSAPVYAAQNNVLSLNDGLRFARIEIPAGALSADDVLTASFPNAAGLTPELSAYQRDAELYLDLSLDSGATNFAGGKQALLTLSYPDADSDDRLDGSGIRVSYLSLAHLPTPTAAFEAIQSSTLDRRAHTVTGTTGHFSVFGLVETQPPLPLYIETVTLPTGVSGTAYNAALDASGGLPPYAWAVTAGVLPQGLGINGGTLEGIPTRAGAFSFTLKVSDDQTPPYTATRTFSVDVYEPARPTVTVTRKAGQPGVTNALPAVWNIVFSEAVSGFATGDVVLAGTAAVGAVRAVTGTGAAYELRVTDLAYDGTLRPQIFSGSRLQHSERRLVASVDE